MLTEEIYGKIEDARDAILSSIKEKSIPFSARLERRSIQLACAMSILDYFTTNESQILINKNALQMALKFFVEEASIRSQEKIDAESILKDLKIRI